ncbi:MAG: glucosaminidase domain-containing protein [Bacteroidota bacterium]|jgi:LysM repeat protein
MKKISILFFFFIFTTHLIAQKITIEEYVNTYKDIAMKEMVRSGVPASITLAQGILETENGNSALVKKSNNHFGIKCKETWTGPSVSHDDDAPQECFRKYENAIASYIDHSDFLRTRKHYHFLFDLDPLDYKAWAYGLKKAGYATNPKYPQILIKYIETYNLHDYSLLAMGKKSDEQSSLTLREDKTIEQTTNIVRQVQPKQEDVVIAVNPVLKSTPVLQKEVVNVKVEEKPIDAVNDAMAQKPLQKPIDKEKGKIITNTNKVIQGEAVSTDMKKEEIVNVAIKEVPSAITQPTIYPSGEFKINETRVVYADKGVAIMSLASTYKLPVKYIYDFNDISEDVQALSMPQLIYLQRKRRVGAVDHHIVQQGESFHDIAQKQGIRLEALLTLNHISKDQKPVVGQKLYLQSEAPVKSVADISMIEVGAHVGFVDAKSDDEYEVHVVQPKQTLYALSKQYNVSIQELMQWNNLSDSDIKEGMELIVSQKDYNVYKSTR